MDASGIGLETGLLQVREGIYCERDEVQDNIVLLPTAFMSKRVCQAECGIAICSKRTLAYNMFWTRFTTTLSARK